LRAVVLYRGLDASLCARADTVIVPSRAVAEDLVMRLGYPARKLVVVPNGIELPPFESRTEVEPGTEVGSRTEVEPGTEVGAHTRTGPGTGELIGTLSVLEPFKGIDVFLRAAAQLAARHPDWRFVTFGSGSDSERLAALARELGIADRVERPGFVAGGEALRRMGVYVLSSYWENAPMALLEAMAAGVPVVASAVDGVPEIVDHNTAQLVPPGDPSAIAEAIERLRANRTLRDAQVLAARDRVRERFTAERNARTIGELYERLISRAAR
jgi:glycosyltransferase involved in cell wall biosynthesis